MCKLLEGLILQRIQRHLEVTNGLSDIQFGVRKDRSSTDAIKLVVESAQKVRKKGRQKSGFSAIRKIDTKNAFNSARWEDIITELVQKEIPESIQSIENYFSDRIVLYEGDEETIVHQMTGTSQGSNIGPICCDVIYDDFLNTALQFDQPKKSFV